MQPAGAEMSVRVEVSGDTPTGRPWDGRSYYLLPAQMGTVSPPDLAICLFTERSSTCRMRDAATYLSVCPDRNWCEFDDLPEPSLPFGVVVYDLEDSGYVTVDSMARKVEDWSRGRTADGPLAGLKSFAHDQAKKANRSNEQRMEFVDAILFSDERRSGRNDRLMDRMRQHVSENAPLGQGGDLERDRIAGPILVKPLEECAFPAPDCRLDYSFIQITLDEDREVFQ